ncbi:MAG: Uma2 family endonuclease [Cyanobacteria bacterium P01_H01_bin.130]
MAINVAAEDQGAAIALEASTKPCEPFYPSEDGEPLAESFLHLLAIITILQVLLRYLSGQEAMVLSDQFLYYVEGDAKKRVAPDVMVIFGVPYGPRDNYKIWEEGQVPSVVFEVTSPSTKQQDLTTKRDLYEQLGVQEYWLFDPKAEWIPEQLRGYRLLDGVYGAIASDPPVSEVLGLRLAIEEHLLIFYRLDTGDRLAPPAEIWEKLDQEQEKAAQEKERADRLAAKLRELGINPDALED